jgi:hypothetical protein
MRCTRTAFLQFHFFARVSHTKHRPILSAGFTAHDTQTYSSYQLLQCRQNIDNSTVSRSGLSEGVTEYRTLTQNVNVGIRDVT